MTNTPIFDFSEAGKAKLREMAENSGIFADYLKFQGRVFKHSVNVSLEFFTQKPDTQFIATKRQWENSHRTVAADSEAIRFVDRNGKFTDFYDFSQVVEETPPPIWTINKQNISKVKSELDLSSSDSIIRGISSQAVQLENIANAMQKLNIPPKDAQRFRQAFINNVECIISGRLEIGGNRFSIKPDLSAFEMLKTDSQRITYLSYAAKSARDCLLKIEAAMQNITARERNEQNDLRNMVNSYRRGSVENSSGGAANNSGEISVQQHNEINGNVQGRSTGLGGNSKHSNGRDGAMAADLQNEADFGEGVLVQARPDNRTLQPESDRGRTLDGGRADWNNGHEVDGLHGGESSGLSTGAEIAAQVPDSSSLSERSSSGLQGIIGGAVQGDESTSDRVQSGTGMGGSNELSRNGRSDEGDSLSTENGSLTDDKINSLFSQTAEKPSADSDSEDGFVVDNPLSDDERLMAVTGEIEEKKLEIIELFRDNKLDEAVKASKVIEALISEQKELKEEIQKQAITEEDVQVLRSIQPSRKSVQNLLEHEVAQTPKFEALLHSEMGEKSAYEMRKSDNSWHKDESKTVPVTMVKTRKLPSKISDMRKGENVKDITRGTFVNEDTKFNVLFARKAIDETISKAIQDNKRGKSIEARVAALYQMQELIKNAVCFDSIISEYDAVTSKNKSPNTLFMHRMYGVFIYNDEPYLANLAVEEIYQKNSEHQIEGSQNRLYNFRDIKITPMKLGFDPHFQMPDGTGGVSTGVTVSIPQLYELVKTYDKSFYENPEAIGRAEREAEIYVHAEYADTISAISNNAEEAVPDEVNKQLELFADIRGVTPDDVKPEIEKNVDTNINFSSAETENEPDIAFSEKVHVAFAEVAQNHKYTERQQKFLDRLENFIVKRHITENMIDEMAKLPAFRFNYSNRNTLSRTVFAGRLGSLEHELTDALKKQFAENSMDKAIRLIHEYCESEFGEKANLSNMNHIGLAYTTDEESELPIEVYADLETFRIVKEYDGIAVSETLYNSLEDMHGDLANLDFDELVALSDKEKSMVATPEKKVDTNSNFSETAEPDASVSDAEKSMAEQLTEYMDSHKEYLLRPRLAFDERVAITDEFFNFEKAWHNVDNDIPELAERYRNGDDIRADLARHIIRDNGSAIEKVDGVGDYVIFNFTTDAENVTISSQTVSKTVSLEEVGDYYLRYLKDTFRELQLERVQDYPEVKEEVEQLLARLDGKVNTNSSSPSLDTVDTSGNLSENNNTRLTEDQIESENNDIVHDQTPSSEQIEDDNFTEKVEPAEIIYPKNPSQKILANIVAVRELKRLEEAEKNGTDLYDKRSNQYNSRENSDKKLRQYSGWGGLQQAFDESPTNWYNRELREILTPEEYKAARATTLNAHYTPQIIIDSMYKAVMNMDLPRDSRILEPSCGTGNFISRMPSSLGNAEVVGIELDPLTAKIAQRLNQDRGNVKIINNGFEHTNLENGSFDLAIGNVPFGDYNLNDPDYVKDWLIHDAFFRRALDKVAGGGVVAFVTSTGTLDKKNPKIREYLAQQAELIGAVRLPNNAFSDAGTKVSTDIIFLKKRDTPLLKTDRLPDWCYTAENEDGLRINSYFIQNPQMILGKMEKTSHFDMLTCTPIEGAELEKQLNEAIKNLNAKITVEKRERRIQEQRNNLQPWGNTFTFQLKDDKVFFNMGDHMEEIKCSKADKEKLDALCNIRSTARQLLDKQKTNISDEQLVPLREELNSSYDKFADKYGSLDQKSVKKLFGDDSDYPIVRSLENVNTETGKIEKSDIFFHRTVNPSEEISDINTAEEALQISIDKKGKPDIPYMATLLEKAYSDLPLSDIEKNVCNELVNKGLLFIDPEKQIPEKAFSGVTERSEYLSGNVRMKLAAAEDYAKVNPEYQRNVDALKSALPEDIRAEEISVQMGCPWIDTSDYTEFLQHLSGRKSYNARNCDVSYSTVTGEFEVMKAGSNIDLNVNEASTYGTADLNMYKIAERLLNQRRIIVQRNEISPYDPDKKIVKTDPKATKLAMEKAKLIKEEFKKWIFASPERKEKYERRYNDLFNSLVGREYDGSHLTFSGMKADFILRPHQKNCVARAIYGGNTLAAHVVGAGKSAVMFSTVMKKKEIGLINKACVVVPKPLTEQVANEWRKLYPDAKLLTVTNDDLSSEDKRKLFTARVATGSYDAVIMSQEQFEKIPMSAPYRIEYIQKQLDALEDTMRERKMQSGGKKDYSVRQIESAIKKLENKLDVLTNPKSAAHAKDNFLDFEQLGFDYLVCDEAHAYKNGFVNTKMQNVAGVTTKPSGRAADMQMKTDYFNEQLGQGHILFCTGTPVSNSMTELYVMTRYLRPDLLKQAGVDRFDDWAATFGNVVTKNSQSADGRLKMKTSFSSFANLPELMAMYKEFADIQSADKLNLPRPELKTGKAQIIKVEATPEQKQYVKSLAARAKAIENGSVDPTEDNLLKITGEARLIGLGNKAIQALYNKREEELPDDFVDSNDSKVDKCIEKAAEIYQQTNDTKGVQIIFSDIAVNADNGNFSVYDYIKKELTEKYNIPENEIIFAPKSDAKNREDIFKDINDSKYRIVIASTGTLGTGANIQKNLYALHHLDIPWKPSDFEQREGRILRQGNKNKEVEIFNYVTEGTLDSYLYQTVLDKARFIAQLMDDKCPARVSADCDEKVLTFGELQAAAEGNPDFKKRIELANEITELKMLQTEYNRETADMQRKLEQLPETIERRKGSLENIKKDKAAAEKIGDLTVELSNGKTITDKKEINSYLLKMVQNSPTNTSEPGEKVRIGDFEISVRGFDEKEFFIEGNHTYTCNAGASENQDNYQRLANVFEKTIAKKETEYTAKIQNLSETLIQAEERVNIPFSREAELEDAIREYNELDENLSGLSEQKDDIVDAEENELNGDKKSGKKASDDNNDKPQNDAPGRKI